MLRLAWAFAAIGGDASNPTIDVWNLVTGARVAQLVGHRKRVNDILFARDGRTVVSCARGGNVRVWDTTADPPGLVREIKAASDQLTWAEPARTVVASPQSDATRP